MNLYTDLKLEKILEDFLKTKKITVKKSLKEDEIELMNFIK